MIAKVKSKDGDTLYVSIKAKNKFQLDASMRELAPVAAGRSTAELLADDYVRTPEELFI